jgi:hypothetical protein
MTMKVLMTSLAAGALALAASVSFAQGPGGMGYGPGGGRDGRHERRGHDREDMRAAYEACKGKTDVRACMTEQMCAKAQDPAQCQARAKERQARQNQRLDQRQQMHEACNGKRGDELANCLIGQRQKLAQQRVEERQKAHEACSGKRGDELTKCLGDRHKHRRFGPGPRS